MKCMEVVLISENQHTELYSTEFIGLNGEVRSCVNRDTVLLEGADVP